MQEALEPQVGHDGGHYAAARQAAGLGPGVGDDGHDLVAVDDLAALVADHQPVGVAVERDADVGAILAHRLGHGLGMGGAALVVDVGPVGRHPDRDHLGAQLVERGGGHLVGGPVGAIDHHPQSVQGQAAREAGLDDLDIAGLGVVDALHAAEAGRRSQALLQALVHQGLDLSLAGVGQLIAVGAEQLDPVVGEIVVRGGDHHPKVGSHGAGHHRHRRRRQRAEQPHVHAHAGEARHQRRLDHVARQAGVLADHHQVAALGIAQEQLAGGQADAQRHLGGHGVLVGLTADAVGAEIASLAHTPNSVIPGRHSRRPIRSGNRGRVSQRGETQFYGVLARMMVGGVRTIRD